MKMMETMETKYENDGNMMETMETEHIDDGNDGNRA